MSDKEEKDTNSEDESSKIPVIITKGNVITVESSSSSAISEKMPRSAAADGSGDNTERTFQENLKKAVETETELIEIPQELLNTEAGKGSGDHTANAKVGDIYDKKNEDKNIDSDAKTSEINIIKKAESSFPFLHICDEIDLKKADDHDEIDDEDMELRWDDDDNPSSPSYLALSDNNGNGDAKNDDILSQDQLLEASADVIAKEMSDMHSEIPKSSENNFERDMLKDKSEENILNEDKSAKEIETTKESKIHQKLGISLETADDEKSLEDELLKEPDLDTEAINSPEVDYELLQEHENLNTEAINSPEMDFEVLHETDLNAEAINSPEVDIPIERSVDKVLEDKLLEESEVLVTAEPPEILREKIMVEKLEESETDSAMQVMAEVESVPDEEEIEDSGINSIKEVIAESTEIFGENQIVKKVWETEINSVKQVISEANTLLKEQSMVKEVGESEIDTECFGEKSVVEPIKETESVEINILKEVTTNKHTKDVSEGIMEDQLLAESESTAETETTSFKMPSLTDVISNKVNDDVMLKENLLKQTDSKIESPEIARKEVLMDKEDDDVLLEDKLLEETETALAIPESDVTMEIDDDKEGELLKDDDYHHKSCTSMDVDVTDQLQLQIGDQAKIEDKILDQPMDNQSEIENNGIVHSIDDQTNIENVNIDESDCSLVVTTSVEDEVKSKEQSDDQAKSTEKTIDQPTEQITSTVLVVSSVENTTEAVAVVTDTPIEEKAVEKVIDKAKSETENIVQLNDDENKIEDMNKELFCVETNITEQSIKSPEQTAAIIVCSTPNVLTENLEKSIRENITLETQINVKIEPEEIRQSKNMDMDLNNPENIKKTVNPVTILDKNNDTEVSPKNFSIFFEDPPVPIKTEHSLHKPDVMIEIPTQELIDMDDTDFSESCLNDVYDEETELEKTVNETISDDNAVNEKSDDKAINDNDTVNDIRVDQQASVDKTVKEKSVDQKTVVTETTIVTEDVTANDNDIPVDQQASVDKTVADDTVKEKSVDQESVVTKTIATDNDTENNKSVKQKAETTIVTDDITVKEKSVDLEVIVTESTVSELQKDSDIVENEKIVEDTVVQPTIEDNMADMFAEDEPEVAKEVPECVASTSQAPLSAEHPPPLTEMTPDTSDEVPEVSDSLGLLAESAGRMMEDDEEPDDDDEGDDDDDFDQDESSNQISAEQSEDSNPAALDAEPAAEQEDKDLETPDPKDAEFMICDSSSQDESVKMDVEVGEVFGMVQIKAETVKQMDEEAKSAVDALLNADNTASEQDKANQEPTERMDVDTVRLSDTSDNEVDVEPTQVQTVGEPSKEPGDQTPKHSPSKSPKTSPKQSPSKPAQSPSKSSPSKMKNLAIATQGARSVVNIVDLEESSSSEDEIQEVQKQQEQDTTSNDKPPSPDPDVTNVNIPTGIEIMCTSGGTTSEITTKEGEVTISGVPKPPPHKPARLNTSEVSIKTVSVEPMVIPETEINDQTATQSQAKLSLEIFSLDSDEEDGAAKDPQKMTALELEKARETSKCINYCCKSDGKVPYKPADASVVAYYDAGRKRRSMVCQPCADVVADRTKNLVQGIKDLTPLLDLEMGKLSQDLVEISDSESEDEDMSSDEPKETIGEKGAEFVENNLAKFLNDTWKKYDMDVRLKETQLMLDDEIEKLEQDSKEIDAMLNECQVATDKLRCELYATFQVRRQEQPALVILDTLEKKYIGLEEQENAPVVESIETRQNKRRLSSTSDTPAKRPAIPLGYAPLDSGENKEKAVIPAADPKIDDDKDISVVKLSAEAAPAELPPPGEISRPPLRVGMPVYAMKNAFGPWLKGKVLDIQPKNPGASQPFSLCRVKFDHKTKTNGKVLLARCIAYSEPADVRMTIGTRLIALFKDTNKRESYYSGVVAEIPNPVNNYRYLVFFDDGYAQYVQHQYTRLVCESSNLVWEEVHPFSREFVKEYLMAYPERPMVRLHEGQHLKTEWNGKWWSSRVTRVDASLAQVLFVGDGRREWIYRGSTRLAPLYLELRAAERHRPRPMPRSKAQPRLNMPYVEYTRSVEQVDSNKQVDTTQTQRQQHQQIQHQQIQNEEIRRQRAVAKKSTSAPPQVIPPAQQSVQPPHTDNVVTNNVTSRVVYYTPKNAVRPHKMAPHRCGPKCKRSDVLSLKELRTYNPLAKPLLSGWERQIVRFKGHKEVMYRAPCGRRLRNMRELHNYLRTTDSDLPVDLFDFHYSTHCLAEFVVTKCLVGKKDLSHGKENVPVPCVNYYDDSLPEFCSYNTERTPTAGVPLNLDPEFLCGCDCTDDCQDKSKCACWKMTLEGARTIGLYGPNVGYAYKRLPEPLPSGIYECNSRCKCRHTCLNRVAQHPLQLKLQVFKTQNRGWGIRALNDVPKGSFLCVYAGNLLTDATANLDGLNEGDEYLAELDYIEVVEQMKEGYEEDIPDADKKLDKKEGKGNDDSDDDASSSEDEDTASKTDKEDDDFRPGYIGLGVSEFSKRLRRREKSKKDKQNSQTGEKEKEKDTPKEIKENAEEDCITISDDEEVREPSRFMAQTTMGANEYISKYQSVRTLFGKDEACYIMDAKVQGNIGRYLNHSCCPNVFVQNVFVDTHDPRFPWVAFFALSHIKAGTELTWNYNYDVGSVPGKILYCFCQAPNCRGRLL